MDILFTLIPLSVTLIFLVLAVLYWAVHAGQFEDLDAEASRILTDDFASGPDDTAVSARSDTPDETVPRIAAALDLDQDRSDRGAAPSLQSDAPPVPRPMKPPAEPTNPT